MYQILVQYLHAANLIILLTTLFRAFRLRCFFLLRFFRLECITKPQKHAENQQATLQKYLAPLSTISIHHPLLLVAFGRPPMHPFAARPSLGL